MKRLAYRLALAIVTFSLGTTAAWLCFRPAPLPLGNYAVAGGSPNPPKLPTPVLPKLSDVPATIGEDEKVTIQFVSQNDGWLRIGGRLWRTSDGGKGWEPIRIIGPSKGREEEIDTVQFVNSRLGWVTGDSGLYRTADGGASWKLLRRSTGQQTDDRKILTGFAFFGQYGWVIENRYRALRGEEVPGVPHTDYSTDGNRVLSSHLLYTDDGGESWAPQTIAPTWNALDSITALGPTHAIAFGIAGVYVLDRNQWKPARPASEGDNGSCLEAACGSGCSIPTMIGFIDERSGWIANSNGTVGRTFDGGRTWTDLSQDLWQGFTDHMYDVQVQFFDERRGYGLNGNGHLVTTRDGGESWQIVENDQEFNRIFFLDDKHGWAVSNDGVFQIRPSGSNDSATR